MPTLIEQSVMGLLRPGWSAQLDEYAVAGAWSARGDRLVVLDAGGDCHAFEGRSGAPVWCRRGAHAASGHALALQPRQALLVTAGQDRRLCWWNAVSGELLHELELSSSMVSTLAWSPGGRMLAVADGRRVRVWDSSMQTIWESDTLSGTVAAVCWISEEELASCGYETVTVWRMPEGIVVQDFRWRSAFISLTASPDGSIIAAGAQDKTVHFWRRPGGEDAMMSGYDSKPEALAFDHSGAVLATSGGQSITVWSFLEGGPEGTSPRALSLHTEPVSSLAFAPRRALLASGGRDGGIIVWDLDVADAGNGAPVGGAAVRARVEHVLWRPDGQALAALDSEGGVTAFRARC